MLELTPWAWLVAGLSAMTVGFSKTGVPGVGILAVLLLADVIPTRESVGVLLPMLIFGDLFAVAYWRRHAVWRYLVKLLPWAMAGLAVGYLGLRYVNDAQLRPLIGAIVLVMLAVNYWRMRRGENLTVPTQWWFAAGMGLLAGTTTMMANAAGPVMTIYLLAMCLPKEQFIGTGAWYFLIVNCLKVPPMASLGLINGPSLTFNLMLTPVIAIGAVAGIFLVKYIPQKRFNQAVQLLAAAAAVRLLL